MKNLLLVALILLSLVVTAQEIKSGIYDVKGIDLSTNEPYEGQCYVFKQCDVYFMGWVFGEEREVGAGVFQDGKLVIVFQTTTGVDYGRQEATIKEDGTIESEWKLFNRECSGKETLTFKTSEFPKECKEKCCKK